MKRCRRWAVTALFLAAAGCAGPSDAPPGVVAQWRGGALSVEEVDRALLELPPERRPDLEGGSLTPEWMVEFVSELAVDRLLADEMLEAERDPPPELLVLLDELDRNLAWEELLRRRLEPIPSPTEEDVRSAFDRWKERNDRDETRRVRNLFLRRRAGESGRQTLERAERIARLARSGESFEALARQYSDSESRHAGGLLGDLGAGDLPAAARDIVFELGEHQVSEPVLTTDGAHLFFVEAIQPAVRSELSDVAAEVRRQLEAERREAALRRLAGSLPAPSEVEIASGPQIERWIADGADDAVVLRNGRYELTLGSLLADPASNLGIERRIELLGWRETAWALANAEGWFDGPPLTTRRQRAARGLIGDFVRRRALRRLLTDDEERLRRFFDRQPDRFGSPLTVRLQRWTLPVAGADRKTVMMALEEAYRQAGPDLGLEAVVDRHGGRIEDLGWQTLDDLDSKATAALVSPLGRLDVTPPQQTEDGVQILRVLERRDPRPRPLAEVRAEAIEAYLAEEGRALYREWRRALLDGVGFELFADRLPRSGEPTSTD